MMLGVMWSAALLLTLITAATSAAGRPGWRPIGIFAALVSIAVLLPSAGIAWAGLLAAVIAGAVLAVAAVHRGSLSPGRRSA